jgi:hypothetical protein
MWRWALARVLAAGLAAPALGRAAIVFQRQPGSLRTSRFAVTRYTHRRVRIRGRRTTVVHSQLISVDARTGRPRAPARGEHGVGQRRLDPLIRGGVSGPAAGGPRRTHGRRRARSRGPFVMCRGPGRHCPGVRKRSPTDFSERSQW